MSENETEQTQRVLKPGPPPGPTPPSSPNTEQRVDVTATPTPQPPLESLQQNAPKPSESGGTAVTEIMDDRQRSSSAAVLRDQAATYEPVDERDLNRLRDLYEAPPEIDGFLRESSIHGLTFWKQPVLCLIGKQNTGKMSAALHIAANTRPTLDQPILRYLDVRTPSLQTLISTVSTVPSSILIVNGFQLSSLDEELNRDANESLQYLAKLLQRNNSLLILTCHEEKPEEIERRIKAHNDAENIRIIALQKSSPEFLQKVIEKHVGLYLKKSQQESETDTSFWRTIQQVLSPAASAESDSALSLRQWLSQQLQSPAQINTFFEQVARIALRQADTEQTEEFQNKIEACLRAEANRIRATDRRTVRDWFRQLEPQTRLYAMLQHLFRGLTGDDIYQIYRRFEEHLFPNSKQRAEQSWYGLEDLDEACRITRTGGQGIAFTLPIYEQEVEQQVDSYRHQLWQALEHTVIPLAENFTAPQFWYLRMHLGHAIGRLGYYDWPQCLELLRNGLAQHTRTPMRALCGHVIAELLSRIEVQVTTQDAGRRSEVILQELADLLQEQITVNASQGGQAAMQTGHSKQRWTAVVTLWRVFSNTPLAKTEAVSNGSTLSRLQQRLHRCSLAVLQEAAEQPLLIVDVEKLGKKAAPYWTQYWLKLLTETEKAVHWYPDFDVVTETFVKLFRQQPVKTIDTLISWLTAGLDNSQDLPRPFESQDSGSKKEVPAAERIYRKISRTVTSLAAVVELLRQEQWCGKLSPSLRRELLRIAGVCLSLPLPDTTTQDRTASGIAEQSDAPKAQTPEKVWTVLYSETVGTLADTLRGWLEEGGETAAAVDTEGSARQMLAELLPAIDRSRDLQRNELVTKIYHTWMTSRYPAVVKTGRLLLARATFAEARCMDFPGGRKVVLILDTSIDSSRMQLINAIAISAAEQLRLESDVMWARMGTTDIYDCDDSNVRAIRQPVLRDHPRLIMPLLEKIGRDKLHYALVLTTEAPVDLADAAMLVENRRLFPFCGRILRPVTDDEDNEPNWVDKFLAFLNSLLFRDEINAANLQQVLQDSREQMENSIAERTAAEWSLSLQQAMSSRQAGIDIPAVALRLQELLPAVADTEHGIHSMRQLQACLQWLFFHAPAVAVSALENSPSSAVGACARLLIRLLLCRTRLAAADFEVQEQQRRQKTQQPGGKNRQHTEDSKLSEEIRDGLFPAVESYEAALRLGPLVGRNDSRYGIQDYLDCLQRLWPIKAWRRRISASAAMQQGLDALGNSNRRELATWLQDRIKAVKLSDESQLESATGLYRLALRQIQLGRKVDVSTESASGRQLVIIYDAADLRCRQLTAGCCRYFTTGEWQNRVQVVVFPLGLCTPVACQQDGLPQTDTEAGQDLPLLIAPAAEAVPREQLGRLLLITERKPADLEDIDRDLAWHGHFVRFSKEIDWAPGWESTQPGQDDATDELVRSLSKSLEFDSYDVDAG